MDLEQLKAYLMAQKEQAPVSDDELASQRLQAGLIDAAREGSDIMSGNEYKGPSGALQERVKASIAARKEADKRNFLLQQLANKKSAEQVVNPSQQANIDAINFSKEKWKEGEADRKLSSDLLKKRVEGYVSDEEKEKAKKLAKDADRDLRKAQLEFNKSKAEQAAKLKAEKPATLKDSQAKALAFGKRIEQSENVFDALEKSGYDRSDVTAGLGTLLPTSMRSSESQQQDQAERNFINAVLRRESGAAISDAEFENAEKQYFPRTGDSPETVAQKRANRQQVLEVLKLEAGDAWDKVPLVSPKGTTNQVTVVHKPTGKTKMLTQEEVEKLRSRKDFNDFEVK